jgi:hypothetical protein
MIISDKQKGRRAKMSDIIKVRMHKNAPICWEDNAQGSIFHAKGRDCKRLHGLRIDHIECSACRKDWLTVDHNQCVLVRPRGHAQMVGVLATGERIFYML